MVKAYVVLRSGHVPSAELTKTLQDHVKQTIAPYKYPRAVAFLDKLPRTDTGKQQRFRLREQAFLRQRDEAEERTLILEYEEFQQHMARTRFEEMNDAVRHALRQEKIELLQKEGRLEKMRPETQEAEIAQMILQDLARKEVPPYPKWLLRKRATQAVLPFGPQEPAPDSRPYPITA